MNAQEQIKLLRDALTKAEYAIKGREHTGFITEALAATATPPAQVSEHAELRRLAEAATPGPWKQRNKKIPYVWTIGQVETRDAYLLHQMPIGDDAKDFHPDTRARWLADAAWIAAANPAAIISLLDELASLRASAVAAKGEHVAYVRTSELEKLADPRVSGVGMMLHKEPSDHLTAIYTATIPSEVPGEAEVRNAALEDAAEIADNWDTGNPDGAQIADEIRSRVSKTALAKRG